MKNKILIAGIAGASLGTEIAKSLVLAKNYEIYGCDISAFAYGHYSNYFQKTFVINITKYIESVLNICLEEDIRYIIPGGESPNILLSQAKSIFENHHIKIVSNNQNVVALCSSKKNSFDFLNKHSVETPKIFNFLNKDKEIEFPCIVKPSEGTGGSSFVCVVKNEAELKNHVEFLENNNLIPVIQEYISHAEGEFTVGVLSSIQGTIIGSIALKRSFESKLSVSLRTHDYLISSGYTQGLIDDFPEIIETCKNIAMKVQSTGPLNIQGRLKNNQFIPFEINPRFSASTYLRALAGFNEVDFYLRNIINGETNFPHQLKYGYYMRNFEETFIPKDKVLL